MTPCRSRSPSSAGPMSANPRLFNRLAGRAAAIVHDTPGVTRDRQAVDAEYDGLSLRLIDTAGFEDGATGSLAHRMTEQTLTAIAEAEALLFVIDARAGVTAGDQIIAEALRKRGKPVILAANKCEGRGRRRRRKPGLGFGEPIAISAEHNLGMDELVEALEALAPAVRRGRRRRRRRRRRVQRRRRAEEDVASIPTGRCAWRWWGGPMSASRAVQPAAGRRTLADRAGSRPDARRHHRALESGRPRRPAA